MLAFDRRGFLQKAGAAALGATSAMFSLPRLERARSACLATPREAATTPGFYRFQLGDFTITVAGDGHFTVPAEIFGANVTAEHRAAYYESRFLSLDRQRFPANPAVIDTGDRRILVDAGTGATGDPPPSTGRLPAALAAAGIAAEDVDLAIVTHAHPDHLGGLVDWTTNAPRFPNAEIVISDTEHQFWTAADVRRQVPESDWQLIDFNERTFAALGEQVRIVPMESEVAVGIHSLPTPGHTPGHIAVLVSSGGEQLLMLGDAIVSAHTHFERPDWQFTFDFDPQEGVRTRRRLLDRIASDRLLVQGFHLPFPGVGHAMRDGSAYRWLPKA